MGIFALNTVHLSSGSTNFLLSGASKYFLGRALIGFTGPFTNLGYKDMTLIDYVLLFAFHHEVILSRVANELMIKAIFWIISSSYFFRAFWLWKGQETMFHRVFKQLLYCLFRKRVFVLLTYMQRRALIFPLQSWYFWYEICETTGAALPGVPDFKGFVFLDELGLRT